MSHPSLSSSLLSGSQLRDAFAAAAAHLRESAAAVDAINVYPVPDGDTGSNMSATFREAVDQAALLPPDSDVSAVLHAIARGALYGARGNSGVILSQSLRGLADGVGEVVALDAAALARGLSQAAAAAYEAVSKPAEGTMLTVLRRAAEEAASAASALPEAGAGQPCLRILMRAVEAAEAAEAETPTLLPALAEAGVPDAGGEGVCVILRGLLGFLTGAMPKVSAIPARPIATMAGHENEGFGFCTEFIIEADSQPLVVEAIRTLVSGGDNSSVVVVGDESAVRVHVHSRDPEAVLAGAASVGKVQRAKVDDMTAQNIRFEEGGSGATAKIGLLALSRGHGLDTIFRGLGARVSDLGEVEKPPAGDIAAAAEAMGKADVIVLPNHKNVVPAALQAIALSRSAIHVVETQTLAEGIAAALAFNPEETVHANLAEMREASKSIRSVEITIAAASRKADGVHAREGDAIVLVDGTLIASKSSLLDALLAGLTHADGGTASLITVYRGEGSVPSAQEIEALVGGAFPDAEIEVVDGGQPLYPLLASVEK